MYYNPLPYGCGLFFEGEYQQDDLYNIYVQHLMCQFELKENHVPCIQIKNNLAFVETEYLESSNGRDVELWLTSTDWKLIQEQYDVYNIDYIDGWKFRSTQGLFKDYIDKWMNVKIESTKTGNKGMRQIAKLMLNSLYGKFALNPSVCSKIPYFFDDVVHYKKGPEEFREPIYIPIGAFITAGARYKTISTAQTVYDRFVYADTDSLHLTGLDEPKNVNISDTALGAWKHESSFKKAKFIRQKSYIEDTYITEKEYESYLKKQDFRARKEGNDFLYQKITCAGMPETCYKGVTWNNFTVGSKYAGKLQPVVVAGGVVLKDREFTIKGAKK